MSKKNNKKSAKKNHNNYKIESLEPRMLMDAAASEWLYEIKDTTLSALTVDTLKNDNFFQRSNWDSAGDVMGLCKEVPKAGSSDVELVAVSKADFMDAMKNSKPQYIASNTKLEDVTNLLEAAVIDANGKDPNGVDADGNPNEDNVLSAEDIYEAFCKKNNGSVYQINNVAVYQKSGVSLTVRYDDDNIYVNSNVFFGVGSDKEFKDCRADVGNCLNLESAFDFDAVGQHYEFSFGLDGDSLTDNALVAARYASLTFNERKNAETRYGAVDLIADQDDGIDLYIGTAVKVDNSTSAVEYRDGLIADFTFDLKDPNYFTGILPATGLSLGKAGLSNHSGWNDVSANMVNVGKATMGRILGKLQELSAKLSDVQNGGNPGDFDFGGILATDAHTLMNLSFVIDSILSQSPKSLQELAKYLENSPFLVSGNSVCYSVNGENLQLKFDLVVNNGNAKELDPQNKKGSNVFDVSISKDMLKKQLNLDVVQNDSVNVETTEKLQFTLEIPMKDPSKVVSTTVLRQMGITNDDNKAVAGEVAVGNLIPHQSRIRQTITDYTSIIENKQEFNSATYVNRVVYYKTIQNELTESEQKTFRNNFASDEFADISPVYGYVIDTSSISKLTYNSKEYETKYNSVATILSVFFADDDKLKKLKVEELDATHVIVYASKKADIPTTVLPNISGLTCGSLSAIWITKNATQKIDVTSLSSPVRIKVNTTYIYLDLESLDSVSSVGELSCLLQTAMNGANVDVSVETDSDRLVFKSNNKFTIEFDSVAVSQLFGFNSTTISSNEGVCIKVKITNLSNPVEVKLTNLLSSGTKVGDLTVAMVMNEIALQCNTELGIPGVFFFDSSTCCLKSNVSGYAVEQIQNGYGYSLASLLGLVLEEDSTKEKGLVDSTLSIDPNDAKIIELSLEITNEIHDKNLKGIDVSGKYGAYDVKVTGRLDGAKIVTTYTVTTKTDDSGEETGEWWLTGTSKYSGGDKVLCVNTPNVTINKVPDGLLAKMTLDEDDEFSPTVSWPLGKNFRLEYGPLVLDKNDKNQGEEVSTYPGLSMPEIYKQLADVVSRNLLDAFYSPDADNKTVLESLNLPFQGKSILDIMGLRGKINEMAKCLEQGECKSLQELGQYFAQNLGVSLVFTLSENGIGIDLQWRTWAINQMTELGGMTFGSNKDVNLGGSLEAYLNYDLTLCAHIDIVYEYVDDTEDDKDGSGTYKAVLDTSDEKLRIDGYVWLSAGNIVTDMNVSVVEYNNGKQENRQKVFQIGDDEQNRHSHLYMLANVGVVDWGANGGEKQSVALRLGGTLYTSMYGIPTGSIEFGVATNAVDKDNDTAVTYVQWNNDGALADDPYVIWYREGWEEPASVAVWNGEDGGKEKSDGVVIKNIVVDLTKLESDLQAVELFDKLRQVADGLSDTVRRAQSGLNSVLLKKTMRSIPLVGDSVVNVADCLTSLESDFVEKFRKYVYSATGLNARAVAEKLYSLLNSMLPTGADKLDATPEYWAGKLFDQYYKGIQYYENDTEAGWRIRLHGSYDLEKNGDFDLGYPGLGLKANGGVEIGLEWTLDIGFGISITDGAFLLLSNGHEADDTASETQKASEVDAEGINAFHAGDDLKIKLTIKPTADLKGSLGFLAMNGWLARTDYTLLLGLDLNDGENSGEEKDLDWVNDKSANRMISFNGLKSGISVEGDLRGDMTLDLNLTLGIADYVNTAPHIDTTLNVKWASDVGNGFGSVSNVAFNDIILDAGTFVQNTIGDVIGKIKSALKPIQPLIDFLQAEIPVLNKLPAGGIHITVLDLIKKYGNSKNMDFGFLDDIIALNNVINKLNTFTNQGIYIGKWELYSASRGDNDPLNVAGMQYMKGFVHDIDGFISNNYASYVDLLSVPQFVNKIAFTGKIEDYLRDFDKNGFDKVHKTSMTSFPSGINGNWLFPLIDPDTAGHEIMKLLMGGHADLVKFDLSPLKFDFDWRKSFPIVGPLCADIGFNFGVCIDLCFGYDTYGIEGWMKSGYKDAKCLVNGFYIDDLDKNGKDVAEVVFHSGIVAGASVCGRAGINVGLNFNVNMDFKDPNYDGKIRLKELADMLSLNPLDMFDFSATIEARAFAYLDLCLYRKEWTLWSSGAFDLFTTASKTTRTASLVSDLEDAVYVNVGAFASNRGVGNTVDLVDDVTITIVESNKVKVTHNSLNLTETVEVAGKPLIILAGDFNDKITIISEKNGNNLVGAKFDIIVDGENGDDTIDMSGMTFDGDHFAMIVGGAGYDTIKGANGGMTVMFGGSAYVSYRYNKDKIINGVKKAISFPDEASIESNIIFGGASSNYIFGGFGADLIVGGEQDDYIFGDGGRITFDNDGKFTGLDSHDLYDEGGADVIFGLAGNDHIYGGAENDSIDAGSGSDEVHAGQGNDVVYGGEGYDQIHGGDGVDVIFGDTPADDAMLIAEQGDENAAGVLPYNYISKEIKNKDSALYSGEFVKNKEMPELYGSSSSSQTDNGKIQLYDFLKDYDSGIVSQIRSLLKDDEQKSAAGTPCFNDVIYGDNGSDIIFGDDGSNVTIGHDIISGGAGNDFIDGDNGNDKIDGDSGDDIIYGGKGNDVLDGGAHNDIVMGDDGWKSYELKEKADSWFESGDSEKVFGDTAKAFGLNFKINEMTRLKEDSGEPDAEPVADGADTIISGNGNDIIDGQGGNDSYNVNFMGDYYSAYTNILESGSDSADSLVINGTISNDDVLIRASNVGLGMIALLPNTQQEIQEAESNDEMANKTRMERINYWNAGGEKRGVEKISLNTGAGSDRISVDSSLSSISVDAGAGNDIINIGQQFESSRDASATNDSENSNNNHIAQLDSFGEKTILTTQGYVSEGVSYASSFIGGDGDDVFNVLHTTGPISLSGGVGDDRFNVGSYIGINPDETTYQVKNGPVSIIGGVGDDSMSINGTEGDDTFVFTKGTVLSANVDVQAIGVENQDVCGGDGDDSFYVLDTLKDSVISIKGNNGNDSFYNGGVQFKADAEKAIDISGGQKEETASEPVDFVFTDKDDVVLNSPEGSLTESNGTGTFEYKICLSRALTGDQKVVMTVFAPVVSSENTQRGDRGVFLKDGDEYVTSKTFVFDKDNQSFNVTVVAFADLLREGKDYIAILHNIGAESNVAVAPCRNMMVFLKDQLNTSPVQNAFVKTRIVTVDESMASNHEIKIGIDALVEKKNVKIWVDGFAEIQGLSCKVDGNILTINWTDSRIMSGTRVHVNYSQKYREIDNESVIQMKYDTAESVTGNLNLAIKTEAYEFTSDNQTNDVVKFVANQKTLQFEYSNSKGGDILDQGGYVFAFVKQAVSKGDSSVVLKARLSGALIIEYHNQSTGDISYFEAGTGYTLSDDMTTMYPEEAFEADGYIVYQAALYFDPQNNRTGPILATIDNNLDLVIDVKHPVKLQCYDDRIISDVRSSLYDYYYKKMGNQIVLYSYESSKPISLTGTLTVQNEIKKVKIYDDEQQAENPLAKYKDKVPVTKNSIEDILGAVLEDGAGEFNDFATAPMMLRYRATDKRNETDVASAEEISLREKVREQREANFNEKKSVDRVFMHNMDSSLSATSSLDALDSHKVAETENPTKNEKKLITAETALLSSDPYSLQFRHQASGSEDNKNISFGNMEYGEINLGSDVDTTTISKTIYRDDGFQTFTVLNSGEGGDTVVVDSYKGGEDDQLVINAGAGDDTVTANGDNVTKDGLIVFGGLGDDTIDVGSNSSLVFGDRGQVLYHDEQGNVVTRLGDDKTGSLDVHQGDDGWNAGGSDYATGKEKGDEAYYQTDGNRYGASIARTVTEDDGGDDTITLANGRNVVFGGLNTDQTTDKGEEIVPVYTDKITTGSGDDLVFGDNGYVTFRGHKDVAEGLRMENMPTVYDEAILSFNFQGGAQTGLNAGDVVGAEGFEAASWNNIAGHLAGTYGNDDSELVYMENVDKENNTHTSRTRVSAVSVSYGGIESHRNSSTDNRINLRPYELNLHGTHTDRNAKMMNSGLMTTAPSDQCDNKLEVVVDGLTQYFERYSVAVYLDLPDANSWQGQSVRLVSLYIDGVRRQAFFVNDPAGYNYSTSPFEKASAKALLDGDGNVLGFMDGKYRYEWGNSRSLQTSYITSVRNANYVVFDIPEGFAGDRIVIRVEDGYTLDNINGKDVPGIAGLQVRGTLRKQDVAASTNIGEGGADKISTDIGDDIVVGGTGSDMITTFGDERYGLYDNDVVFGDNAKMVFTDRDGDINTVSTISSAESLAVTNLKKSYDDKIYTGDGNDNVVGGIGSDHIEAGARTDAVSMMDNINVLSINFTREACDKSDSIAQGEAAGVVVDTEWHNFYRNDRGVIVSDSTRGQNSGDQQYNNMMDILCNNPLADNPYAVAEGVEVQLYGKNNNQRQTVSSFTIDNYDELDGDTSNAKLYNTYLAAQQSEEIVLKLKHMNTFVGNNVDTYDVYVYLGGDNNDTDTFNYIYDICLKDDNGRVHRYLNDWTGRTFDGDYLEAYCSSESIALSSLQDGSAPMVGLVGNYVVFHGVKGDLCDIRIKNLYTSSGQAPKNLPMISAVQIVAGEGRNNPYLAIGGDHDKDLVYGDDAKLSFDVDVPYAVNERLNNYQNRVIEAKSIAIDQTAVETIETEDTIITGKDRDVVVGGEGSDTIRMGDGDDIAIGSSANLLLEHNNPLGVFTPNTEIVLDQHTINTNLNQKYLDNDNSTESQFQNRLNQNRILGIDKTLSKQNDRKDDIQVGEGRNLVYAGSNDTSELVVKPQTTTDPGTEQPGTDQPGTDQPGTDQPGTEQPGTDQPGTDQPETIEYTGTTQLRFNQPVYVNVKAGENIRLVGYTWDGINQWASNLVLRANASNGVFPQVTFTYRDGDDLRTVTKNQPGSGEEYYFVVDIPNGFNDVDENGNPCIAVYVTASADTTFMLTFGCGNA